MRSMIAALVLCCCALTVQAETITVCASGCDYTSIQAAVDAASDYDTIEVGPGTYNEYIGVWKKPVNIHGTRNETNGALETIVVGGIDVTNIYFGEYVVLKDLDIRSDGKSLWLVTISDVEEIDIWGCAISGSLGVGVYADYAELFIDESTISENQGGGVHYDGWGTHRGLWIVKSTIRNNSTPTNGGGIRVEQIGLLQIEDSEISDNAAVLNGGGIWIDDLSLAYQMNLWNSTVKGNMAENGAGLYVTSDATYALVIDGYTFEDNTATSSGGGIFIDSGSSIGLENSILCGNTTAGSSTDTNQIEGVYTIDETSCLSAVCTDVDEDGIPDGCQVDEPCPTDIDGNGVVNGADLSLVLGAWATSDATADIDGSGTVDGADLALVLGSWGSCPE